MEGIDAFVQEAIALEEHRRLLAARSPGVRLPPPVQRPKEIQSHNAQARQHVAEIAALRKQGLSIRKIASTLGLAHASVQRITCKIPFPVELQPQQRKRAKRRPITPEERRRMIAMRADKMSLGQIAKTLGRHISAVAYHTGGWKPPTSKKQGAQGGPMTDKELEHIRVLYKLDYSPNEIAKRIGRSGSTVYWYIRKHKPTLDAPKTQPAEGAVGEG